MPANAVPVSMGSAQSISRELSYLNVDALWFPPGLKLPAHTHDRPVFGVMLQGGMRGRLGTRSYECPAGTVFTEPAGERHDNVFSSDGSHVLAILPDTCAGDRFEAFAGFLQQPMNFRDAAIAVTAQEVLSELLAPDDLSMLAVESGVLEMFVAAARRSRSRPASAIAPVWLQRTRDLLHERRFEKLKLADVARESGVHARHLTRMFRRCYGTSVAEYVRGLRLDWAAGQLRSDGVSLSAVAIKAGFADQSHFTRAFRRRFGITPARFRSS